jgi:DNA-binding IclR family transcriptional regulator
MTDPTALRERLARVREDGYAWVHEEFADGLNSVAAPVIGPGGDAVAAVHVHGPTYRFPVGHERDAGRGVAVEAAKLAARLRHV